ncbi:MAG: hypothetical protein RLY40_472 [Pseudomonadota bacterium]|jgi:hypothetical protein
MPKKIKFGLFSCAAVQKEKIEISIRIIDPISEIPELTEETSELIDSLDISYENKKLLKEIFQIGNLLLKNFSKLNEKEKDLLSLSKGVTKLIVKEFINKEKILEKTEGLEELINKWNVDIKQIDWNKFKSRPPTPSTTLVAPAQAQHSAGISSFSERLLEVKLKKIGATQEPTQPAEAKNNQLPIPNLIQIQTAKQHLKSINNKKEPQKPKETAQQNDFANNLKPVKHDLVPQNYGIKMSKELAIKLAQQNAKIEKTLNTDNITIISKTINNDAGLPPEATELLDSLRPYLTEEDFDNLEFALDEKNSENKLDKEALQKIRNDYCWEAIVPVLKELQSYLEQEEFIKINTEIMLKNSMNQLNEKTFQEFSLQAAAIKNNYFYDKISPLLEDLKRYLSPEKFTVLNDEIAIKNSENQLDERTLQEVKDRYAQSLRHLSIIPEIQNPEIQDSEIQEAVDELDERLEDLQKIINELENGRFSSKTPLSMQFKPPTRDNDAPSDVGEILKPIPKM